MPGTTPSGAGPRLAWVDRARALGIALVFYGHLVEVLNRAGVEGALSQMKFVYSFHVPLFFVLSGFVARTERPSFRAYLVRRVWTRLVPALFFCLLGFALSIPFLVSRGEFDAGFQLSALARTLVGTPTHNTPMWFLFCLFSVELLHFGITRWLSRTGQLLGVAVACYAAGWLLCWRVEFFSGAIPLRYNFLLAHEALVAYAFFLGGVLVRRLGWLERPLSRPALAGLCVLAFVATALSFDLNRGPFIDFLPLVLMVFSSHGHPVWFPLTALLGTAGIVTLAKLLPDSRGLSSIGRLSLVLLGLAGLLHHGLNPPLISWLGPRVPGAPAGVAALASALTLLSLVACLPVAALMRRFLPRLTGGDRPRR